MELTAEAHAQVGTLPKEIRYPATACEIPIQPANVRHGFLAANISQTALMRILEGLELLEAAELLLTRGYGR